ncbi:hypothetical protein [Actinomycetospora chiangmaiensis]|uniref:hypothetical protein n=1 Tax=Actinomycetospora chiangmaiensis TaxID=402650 RepID=UPI000376032F|nr:hypothetical protein [Actinomycetospora chiangmaiensis]
MTVNGERALFWPGLATARELAAEAGARTVGTQHLLLAVLRRAEADAAAADCQVLDALLAEHEPSLAHLVLTALGAHRRVRLARQTRRTRLDGADGDLVDA